MLASGQPAVVGGQRGDQLVVTGSALISGDRTGREWTETFGALDARHSFCSVMHPTGTWVVCGGVDSAGSLLRDCWRSDTGGITWTLTLPAAPWPARHSHSCTLLANGQILLVGGHDDTSLLNDVWISGDIGATWTPTQAPQWSPRHAFALVSVPPAAHATLLVGGNSTTSSTMNDVWASFDGGTSWVQQTDAAFPDGGVAGLAAAAMADTGFVVVCGGRSVASGEAGTAAVFLTQDIGVTWERVSAVGWGGRFGHHILDIGSASLVVLGGWSSTGQLATAVETFTFESAPPLWREQPCSKQLPAICGLFPGRVKVALPANVTQPPNARSGTAAMLFSPLAAAVQPATSQRLLYTLPLSFAAAFTDAVSGVSVESFNVSTVPSIGWVAAVTGAGTSWTLDIQIDTAALVANCPDGFIAAGQGTPWCAKPVESLLPWAESVAACSPFALASPKSVDEHDFYASVRGSAVDEYWYVELSSWAVLVCTLSPFAFAYL